MYYRPFSTLGYIVNKDHTVTVVNTKREDVK